MSAMDTRVRARVQVRALAGLRGWWVLAEPLMWSAWCPRQCCACVLGNAMVGDPSRRDEVWEIAEAGLEQTIRAKQRNAEQSRVEQDRAEQSRAAQRPSIARGQALFFAAKLASQ